ncbi:MAG: glycoside hydrolase family 88 protein, partial [Lachnospiraceae bacterium]|nr:glycoside hydrolase family 88 protein [Lachnospiraceae bacterium]
MDLEWVNTSLEKIFRKMPAVTERSKEKFPYTTVNGTFDDQTTVNPCWWTNGFWGGMMWQLYHATGNELYREAAEINEEKLDPNLMDPMGLDHDNGFKWLPTAVANYKVTGSRQSFRRGLLAANNLAGRFNLAGNYIRAWNDDGDGSNAGVAIIDCLMNLPLLYWASEETHDPRFYQIARRHADTALRYFQRADGSVIHIGKFDPVTGEFLESVGGQGIGKGTSWTRGQGWAVYGFTLSYLHTKSETYLKAAERAADYVVAQIPESFIIPVDFCQPRDCGWEDSTAAAILSCGLIELSKVCSEKHRERYYQSALHILNGLCTKRANYDQHTDHLLEKCSAAYHDSEHNFAIIYGDYYFIEA